MSKTIQKNRRQVEYYEGIIKKKDAYIKRLQQEIKELKKWERLYEDSDLEEQEPEIIIPNALDCPKCKDGELEYHDFVHVQLMKCNNCTYSEKTNAKKEETQINKKSSNTKASRSKPVVARKKSRKRAGKRKG